MPTVYWIALAVLLVAIAAAVLIIVGRDAAPAASPVPAEPGPAPEPTPIETMPAQPAPVIEPTQAPEPEPVNPAPAPNTPPADPTPVEPEPVSPPAADPAPTEPATGPDPATPAPVTPPATDPAAPPATDPAPIEPTPAPEPVEPAPVSPPAIEPDPAPPPADPAPTEPAPTEPSPEPAPVEPEPAPTPAPAPAPVPAMLVQPPSLWGLNLPAPANYYDNRGSAAHTDLATAALWSDGGATPSARTVRGDPVGPSTFMPFWFLDPSDIRVPFVLTLPAAKAFGVSDWYRDNLRIEMTDLGVDGDVRRIRVTYLEPRGFDDLDRPLPGGPPDQFREWRIGFDQSDILALHACSQPVSMRREGDASTGYYTARWLDTLDGLGILRGLDTFGINNDVRVHADWAADQTATASAASFQQALDRLGPGAVKHQQFYGLTTDDWLRAQARFEAASGSTGYIVLEWDNETWNPGFVNGAQLVLLGIARGYDSADGVARCPDDRASLDLNWGDRDVTTLAHQADDVVAGNQVGYHVALRDTRPGDRFSDTAAFRSFSVDDGWANVAMHCYVAQRLLRACQIYEEAGITRERIVPVLSAQMGNWFGTEWEDVVKWTPPGGTGRLVDYGPRLAYGAYLAGVGTAELRAFGPDWRAGLVADLASSAEWTTRMCGAAAAKWAAMLAAEGAPGADRPAILYEGGCGWTFPGLTAQEAQDLGDWMETDEYVDAYAAALRTIAPTFWLKTLYQHSHPGFGFARSGINTWAHHRGLVPTGQMRALRKAMAADAAGQAS